MFADFDPEFAVLLVLAVLAGLGIAHFLANRRKEGIRRSKAFYRISKLCHDAGADHHEKYYLAKATGDLFESARQAHEIEELAINTAAAKDKMDACSEKWLLHEATDPRRRRKIIHDLERLEREHHGDELGALLAAEARILKGVKEQAIVPTGDGKAVTVPIVKEVHHHYGAPAAPPAQAAAVATE